MAEYIERRKAAEVLCKIICGSDCGLCVSTPENCQQKKMLELYELPAADVVPVVHGKWIFNDDWWEFNCTNCHKAIGNIKKYNYCPHCGAKMDL